MEQVELANGIKLEVKSVSPMLVAAAMRRLPKPRVPKEYIDSKGREEENPMHPDYLDAMDEYEHKRAEAANDVCIMMGTKIVSVPQGLNKPADEGWAEDLRAVGFEVPEDVRQRYLQWVKYYAVSSGNDMVAILEAVRRASGVTEDDVADAADSFPGNEERGPDLGARRKKAR